MLVAIALANRIARIAWALMANGGVYRRPATAVLKRRWREPSVDVVGRTEDYGQTVKRRGRENQFS